LAEGRIGELLVLAGAGRRHVGRRGGRLTARRDGRAVAHTWRYATALVKLGDQYFGLKRYKDAADAFDRALVSDRAAVDAAEVTKKRDRARELAGK
jgi:hypothetical protein